jgi:hypothetical protein
MDAAVERISKRWVGGKSVTAEDAILEVDEGQREWRVRARLGEYSPWRHRFGLSVQLDDGRSVHGPAMLVPADDDYVTFEGTEGLEGSL